jgi:hypothetical protein
VNLDILFITTVVALLRANAIGYHVNLDNS